ncbi:MAG: hypothetical protein AB1331_02490 [Bacillota bacterium]
MRKITVVALLVGIVGLLLAGCGPKPVAEPVFQVVTDRRVDNLHEYLDGKPPLRPWPMADRKGTAYAMVVPDNAWLDLSYAGGTLEIRLNLASESDDVFLPARLVWITSTGSFPPFPGGWRLMVEGVGRVDLTTWQPASARQALQTASAWLGADITTSGVFLKARVSGGQLVLSWVVPFDDSLSHAGDRVVNGQVEVNATSEAGTNPIISSQIREVRFPGTWRLPGDFVAPAGWAGGGVLVYRNHRDELKQLSLAAPTGSGPFTGTVESLWPLVTDGRGGNPVWTERITPGGDELTPDRLEFISGNLIYTVPVLEPAMRIRDLIWLDATAFLLITGPDSYYGNWHTYNHLWLGQLSPSGVEGVDLGPVGVDRAWFSPDRGYVLWDNGLISDWSEFRSGRQAQYGQVWRGN